jgi:N-acetyl-alpha-D-muramate 1-phosphate uridylyltransferase
MFPVAIIAGGLATRLRPITERIPKSLIEVNGEPFLAHQLRLLTSNGIKRVTMCLGFLGEMVEAWAGDGSRFGVQLTYSYDGPRLLGTAGALRKARPLLGENFFVLYGDSYLPCDYTAVQRAFEASGKTALMTVFHNLGQWDSSNVHFENGRILAYDKKVRPPEMHHIDYGLGVFHAAAFDDVPDDRAYDLADVYQRLLARGELAGLEVPQRFYETGSFAGIEELSGYLSARKTEER